MKETQFDQAAITALQVFLGQIPFLDIDRIERPALNDGPELQVWVRIRGQPRLLVAIVKQNGQPRFARQAAYELKVRLNNLTNAYGIFIAPYISSEAGRICEEVGIGHLDLAGNGLLSFETIYIRLTGAPNPKIQRRDLRSLYSPKAERLLRVLLNDPQRTWKMSALAQACGVSLGQVANVKKRLLDREWISTPAEGMRLIKPAELLNEWAQAYNFKRNEALDCYAMAEIPEIEALLAETCQKLGLQYAMAGFSSAARIAPMVRYQRASAYVKGDTEELVQALGWKPVTSGANMSLLAPYDDGVFFGAEEVGGVAVTTRVQTYLDLQSQRGRGQEAAQAVRKVMEKSW